MNEEIFPPNRDDFIAGVSASRIDDLSHERLASEDILSLCDIRYQKNLRSALIRLCVVMSTRTKIAELGSDSHSNKPSKEELERFLSYLRSSLSPFYVQGMSEYQELLRGTGHIKAFYALHLSLAAGMAVSYMEKEYKYIIVLLVFLLLSSTAHLSAHNKGSVKVKNFESILEDRRIRDFFENLRSLYEEQRRLQEEQNSPSSEFEEYRQRILKTLNDSSRLESELDRASRRTTEESDDVAQIYTSLTTDAAESDLRRALRQPPTLKPPKHG